MAVKPTIDLTTIISRAVSGLRLRERVGKLPNVESKRTRELAFEREPRRIPRARVIEALVYAHGLLRERRGLIDGDNG